MPDDIHFYEPANGHGLPHDPFNAIVGPRPIGWISSKDAEGRLNLAPYSFFNAFNYIPPIIGFFQCRTQRQPEQHRTNRRVRLEPGHPSAGRADEPEQRHGQA
ncbi:UNVERIFIED_ORG: flavin reductase (DIM6/NTAB) family NADH-FMN oxidoreductase RutF [Pseudomonas reinekei]|nr:flavin reductase (DIM6/NTAB) family NADH-FMN oxidoreductase RutF [Pseudomonas reinekei]